MSELAIEATIKVRDGKKWKKRFCVLQKPETTEPTSFALLNIYKNVKLSRKPGQKRRVIRLETFYGLESGFVLDKEGRTLAIICHPVVVILAFDSDQTLTGWELWLRHFFGHGCQYSVYVIETPSSLAEIRNANARLHLRDHRFCLVVDTPPRITLELNFHDVRRYGAYENKFYVEVGSRCGAMAGDYVFRSGHRDQMTFTFRLASEGQLHKYLSGDTTRTNYASDSMGSGRSALHTGSSYDGASSGWSERVPLLGSLESNRAVMPIHSGDSNSFACDVGSGSSSNIRGHSFSQHAAVSAVSKQSTDASTSRSEAANGCHRSSSETNFQVSVMLPRSSASAPTQTRASNYVNDKFLSSLHSYYNTDRLLDIPDSKGGTVPLTQSYLAMVPKKIVYEVMDPNSAEGTEEIATRIDPIVSDQKILEGSLVKPFEPLILRKRSHVQLPPYHPPANAARKFSLPAVLASQNQNVGWRYARRFSLEERITICESHVSTGGGGIAAMFRSTGGLAKEMIRSGSLKARLFFESLVRRASVRKFSRASKSDGEAISDDGRQSRAYSEPPMGAMGENSRGRSPMIAECDDFKYLGSSLDLDEVVYDISSVSSAQQLPSDVLRRIGLKPLVPESSCQSTSSSIRLPVCPIRSFGTDSTRSSDSVSIAAASERRCDRNSVIDSISVGSDNSDSDSVFDTRTTKKKQSSRMAGGGQKVAGTSNTENHSEPPIASAPLIRKLTSTSTLEPHRLSVNAKRRLRQDLTKPLSGSYSRYDGDGSCDSPMMSPSVLMSGAKASMGNLKRLDSHQEQQRQQRGYCKFELGGNYLKKEKVVRKNATVVLDCTRSVPNTHSPSPPKEMAPPPPMEHQIASTTRCPLVAVPRSALPRLEGHIFKFPTPTALNYAQLAAQDEISHETPLIETDGNCQSPRNAVSPGPATAENSVEYAKIDKVATQAARQVSTSRQEEVHSRWSSTHTLATQVSETHSQEDGKSGTSTSTKCRRPFSLKRPLLRRRTSAASLAGF